MKKLLLIVIIVLASCSPYNNRRQPVHMKYSIFIPDYGVILCQNYRFSSDTLFLINAGKSPNITTQYDTRNMKIVGKNSYLIVPIEKKKR